MALSRNHEGKHFGLRGHALSDQRETNMYAPYSWHRSTRGKLDELHWAMGLDPKSFTYRGQTQGLPVNYGRWIPSQRVVMSLRANDGLPSIPKRDAMHNALLIERLSLAVETGEFATSATHLESDFGLKQVLGSVGDEVVPDNEDIAEAATSSLPESKDHRANVPPPLEACRKSVGPAG
eukprot:6197284-Pleurochrysis_carterae.AAC.2